ncbi:putative protease Do-like 14 isoform X1 [Daucus carota subsp. sativus]|uniref:putative protease Do-like 14 isoform X1 n=1 Tax=Daucus carota subsp. sativus TaxID=79200 RepID=UPI0007EFEE14|nr:PREDICTED: putative protease Do-like 14 isoform X2 [Daucus carota subsp. sativus]XP_017223399.1 PREDICTED: putative protease Do-like 14 isoform X2 [Daucus carota subsp. sativus]XP_017223400.1 PREDICTED: putative protease Do-like 14 isoform X2 [Daucus carota subsp. sativus]
MYGYSPTCPSYSPYDYSRDYEPGPELCLRFPDKKETGSLDARFDQSPVLKKILDYYVDQKPSRDSLWFSKDDQYAKTTVDKKKLWRIYSKITPSVVSVSSFFGVERKIDCSGLIIDWNSIENEATVLTSAKLLWSPKDTSLEFHLIVRTADGTLFLAREDYVDYHYNLLTLKIKSTIELKVVDLRCRQAEYVERMSVIALGRAFQTCLPFDYVGELSLASPNYGCDELLMSTCKFSEICEGGPLITDTGYVIGINFKDAHSLPAAVILSCLEMWRSFGTVVRPWFGMSVVDVDQLSYWIWERYNIPVEGSYVVVKEVLKGSIADKNDVHPGDLVSTCNGVSIRSAKQYSQLLSEASQVLTACADSSQQSFTLVINPFDRHTDNISIEAEQVSVDDKRFNYRWRGISCGEWNKINELLRNPGHLRYDPSAPRYTPT